MKPSGVQVGSQVRWIGAVKRRVELYQALRDCNKAIELDPGSVCAFCNRALAKSELGMYREAIADYDRALELDPTSMRASNNRGSTKIMLGMYAAAIEDYDRTIKLDPNSSSAFCNRALAKRKLGRHQEALADWKKTLALDPILGVFSCLFMFPPSVLRLRLAKVEYKLSQPRELRRCTFWPS